MKKLFLLSMMCLMALTLNAQRCAVLDFQVGTGVTEEDIEGISFEFRSRFNPSGYKMLERGQINRAIQKFGHKTTDMTSQQVLKVGRSLDASIIVVGTMNKFMDEYSVEIRAIDVSSGRTIASEGSNFERTAYRSSMQKAAQNLSNKLSSEQGGSSSSSSFSSGSSQYVDLGLPSGTLWKSKNEAGGFYTFGQAISKFGNKIPAKWQWQELISSCQWVWTGGGYKVIGVNGNSIYLPATGWCTCEMNLSMVGEDGFYWSSTTEGTGNAWRLGFAWNEIDMDYYDQCFGRSVRLVQSNQ